MRIYFGRYPDKANHVEVKNIDHFFLNFLMDADYDFDLAVSNLIKSFDKTTTYYTCNPLIINFLKIIMQKSLYI